MNKNTRATQTEIKNLPLHSIKPPERAMRKKLNRDTIDELADSIQKIGLLQPIIVKPKGPRYEIVAGHRRWEACRQAGFTNIACLVLDGKTKITALHTYHENLQREQVPVVDEAEWLLMTQKRNKLSNKQLAKMLGRSESYISERLGILKYPEQLRNAVNAGTMTFSAARELSRINNPQIKENYIEHAIRGGINDETARQWRTDANAVTNQQSQIGTDEAGGAILPPLTEIKLPCFVCDRNLPLQETTVVRICTRCVGDIREAAQKSETVQK